MREESSYPESPFLKLSDKNRTFLYEIIKEGTYPPLDQCYYTQKPRHPIPNDYMVKTQHGKKNTWQNVLFDMKTKNRCILFALALISPYKSNLLNLQLMQHVNI